MRISAINSVYHRNVNCCPQKNVTAPTVEKEAEGEVTFRGKGKGIGGLLGGTVGTLAGIGVGALVTVATGGIAAPLIAGMVGAAVGSAGGAEVGDRLDKNKSNDDDDNDIDYPTGYRD